MTFITHRKRHRELENMRIQINISQIKKKKKKQEKTTARD